MQNARITGFQDIIEALPPKLLVGTAKRYDRVPRCKHRRVPRYFKDAWPESVDKFAKGQPDNPEDRLVQKAGCASWTERHPGCAAPWL